MTLVEILIGVAIIALLVVLVLPTVNGMLERASAANCAASMRALGGILMAYRAEHNGYFPTGIQGKDLLDPITAENDNPLAGASVSRALLEGEYLKEGETPLCPAMRVSAKGMENLRGKGQSPSQHLKETGSYALNAFLLQVKPEALPGQYWHGTRPYPGDSKMVFLAEHHAGIGGRWEGLIWANSNTALDGVDYGTSINVKGRNHGNKQLNFMFLDGHISKVAPITKADGSYDWTESFDSWGRDGKYINAKRLRE